MGNTNKGENSSVERVAKLGKYKGVGGCAAQVRGTGRTGWRMNQKHIGESDNRSVEN